MLLFKIPKVMQIFSILMVWKTGAFSIDRLYCLLFVWFLPWVCLRILRLGWKAKLKPWEIVALPLQEGTSENIRFNSLLNIC